MTDSDLIKRIVDAANLTSVNHDCKVMIHCWDDNCTIVYLENDYGQGDKYEIRVIDVDHPELDGILLSVTLGDYRQIIGADGRTLFAIMFVEY